MKLVDIKQFIPESIKAVKNDNSFLTHIQDNDEVYYIWYETPISNQKGIVGTKIREGILPKEIVFDDDTYEVLGLLQGEMSKSIRQTLTFANSEPGIMNQVLAWFERTGLAMRNSWNWYVRVNLVEPVSQPEVEAIDMVTVREWIKLCELLPEKAYKKRLPFVAKTNNRKLTNIGTLMVEHSGPVFVQTVQKVVSETTASIFSQSEKEIKAFMRGIIAAESCVNFHQASGQRKVFITAINRFERDTYIECLRVLEIHSWDSAPLRCLIISGRENLLKLHTLGLMTLHPDKHARFLEMITSYNGTWHERRGLTAA